jgi:hypothetical protein
MEEPFNEFKVLVIYLEFGQVTHAQHTVGHFGQYVYQISSFSHSSCLFDGIWKHPLNELKSIDLDNPKY